VTMSPGGLSNKCIPGCQRTAAVAAEVPQNEHSVPFQLKRARLAAVSPSKVTNLTCLGYGLMLVPSISYACYVRAMPEAV
jgi:hypothetical protein